MRRRGEPAPAVTPRSDPPPRPDGVDWVSDPGVAPAGLAGDVALGRMQGEYSAAKVVPTDGPAALPELVSAGDQLLVTMGKEVYYPGGAQKFQGFEVGPMSITVSIRKGESGAQAWVRGRSVLEHLFEAELKLRIAEFVEHLDVARKTVRGDP